MPQSDITGDRAALARRLARKVCEEAGEAYRVPPESQTCAAFVTDLVELVAIVGMDWGPEQLRHPASAETLAALRGGLLRLARGVV